MAEILQPEKIHYILEHSSESDLLCLIAEEASELAQAAMKLKRVLSADAASTPVTIEEAEEHLNEEWADVLNASCIFLRKHSADNTEYDTRSDHVFEIMVSKIDRWYKRLTEGTETKE